MSTRVLMAALLITTMMGSLAPSLSSASKNNGSSPAQEQLSGSHTRTGDF